MKQFIDFDLLIAQVIGAHDLETTAGSKSGGPSG